MKEWEKYGEWMRGREKNITIVKLIKNTFLNNKNRDELKDKNKSVSNKEKSG